MTTDVREIGKYRLEARLGSGGYGEVWRGWLEGEQGFRKPVAVKLIREASGDHAVQFVNEARIGARLRHPNIVDVYEFARIDGQYLLAMELVEGRTLESLLDASPDGLPCDRATEIVRQIASALRYAHELGDDEGEPFQLVHRDLKPAKVMIDRNGVVKVLDFGIALYRTADRTTGPGMAKGTLCYMAPEQLQGAPPSQAVDIWALGAIAYEAVTGKPLVPPGDMLQAVLAIQDADGPELAARMRMRCPALADVVEHTLVERPSDRWTAAGILERLDATASRATWTPAPTARVSVSAPTWVGDAAPPTTATTMPAVPVPPAAPEPPPPVSRRTPILAGVALLGTLLLALAGWAWTRHEPDGLVRGGELRIAWPRARGALDPYERATTLSTRVLRSVLEPLVRLDRDGRPVPGPIEAWSEDDRTITLTLRAGVRFHPHPCLAPDGRPATADDVRASIERGRDAGRFHAEIAEVRVTGDRTVEIALTQRSPFAIRDLAGIWLLPADLERCETPADLRQPTGTGPFRFAGPTDGASLEVVANPDYWRTDELGRALPYLDGIRAVPAPADEATSAADALRDLAAGALDAYDAANGAWLKEQLAPGWQAPPGVRVIPEDVRGVAWTKGILVMRERPRPLSRELRQAVARALDREALARGPDAEELIPGDRLLPPVAMGYDPGLLVLPRDPAAASAAVAAAGGWTGEPLVLGAFESDQGLADGIAASLGEIGLPVRVVRFAQQSLEASLRDPQADMLIVELYGELWGNDPYPELADLVTGVADTSFASADVQADLTRAAHEVDRTARERLYTRIERGLLEDAGYIPLGSPKPGPTGGVAIRAGVHGLTDATDARVGSRDLATVWIDPAAR